VEINFAFDLSDLFEFLRAARHAQQRGDDAHAMGGTAPARPSNRAFDARERRACAAQLSRKCGPQSSGRVREPAPGHQHSLRRAGHCAEDHYPRTCGGPRFLAAGTPGECPADERPDPRRRRPTGLEAHPAGHGHADGCRPGS
jgi:hypothetical protein